MEACRDLLAELDPSPEQLAELRRPSHRIARWCWELLRDRGTLPSGTRSRSVALAVAAAALQPLPSRTPRSSSTPAEARASPPPPDAQAVRLWRDLWPRVEASLGREAEIWLRHAVPVGVDGDCLTLWVPDAELAAFVAEHLLPSLLPALDELQLDLTAPTEAAA